MTESYVEPDADSPGKWMSVFIHDGFLERNHWSDDPLNEDGSKPEGWMSAEERALMDACGSLDCCS